MDIVELDFFKKSSDLQENCLRCFLPNTKACPKKNNIEAADFLIIALMITDECNKNCEYCWHHASNVHRGVMTKENIDHLFEYFKKHYPTKFLIFSILGGEPGLYPELIEYVAQKTIKHNNGKCLINVYSNGTVNIKQLIEISKKYPNIIYNISMNHEAILEDPECYKYFTGSIVFTEKDDIYKAYEKIKKIKELGYKKIYINFNMYDTQVFDKDLYLRKGLDLLMLSRLLCNKDFVVTNLICESSWGFINFKPEIKVVLNYYPDEKFYLTHFKDSPPIGDLTKKIDLNYWNQYLLDNSPCINCKNLYLCRTYHVDAFVQNDNSIKKQEIICVQKIMKSISTEKYGITIDGKGVILPYGDKKWAYI